MTSCVDSVDDTSIHILFHPVVVESRYHQSRELLTSHLLGQSCCRAAARKWFSCPTSDSKEQDTFVCFPAEEGLGVFELVSYSLYFQIHLFHKRLDSPRTKLKAPPNHDSTNEGPQGKERGRPSKSDILEQHPEPLLGCRKRSWLL